MRDMYLVMENVDLGLKFSDYKRSLKTQFLCMILQQIIFMYDSIYV